MRCFATIRQIPIIAQTNLPLIVICRFIMPTNRISTKWLQRCARFLILFRAGSDRRNLSAVQPTCFVLRQKSRRRSIPFNFALIHAAWNAKEIGGLIADYEAALPPDGWPNWVLGIHAQPRIAARVGGRRARTAAMLLLALRGTPTMYYGDEIGLARVAIPQNLMQDPWEKNEPGLGVGRDPWRTPLQ